MTQTKPYIGITGLKTKDEIKNIAEIFEKNNLNEEGFDGMMGFLCDTSNIINPKKSGRRSPSIENMNELIDTVPKKYIAMVHYHTNNYDSLFEESIKLRQWIPNFRYIQYNVDWPSIQQLKKIEYDICENIVLQLPQRAIEYLDHKQVARITQAYDGLAKYVLIDMSGGKGIELNEQKTSDLAYELSQKLDNTIIGVAGGLSAENVAQKVRTIREDTGLKKFCIDAEGKLRKEDIQFIDMNKVENYIRLAMRAFK